MPDDSQINQTGPEPPEATIASIVGGSGEGRRSFSRISWLLGLIAIVCVVLALFKPKIWPPTKEEIAAKIISLPPGAELTKVTEGEDAESGEIWFSLYEPKGPGSRLKEIWARAALPARPFATVATAPPAPAGKSPAKTARTPARSYFYDSGDYRIRLTYDAKTRLYHYVSQVKH